MGIRSFFDDTLSRNEHKEIRLNYKGREYLANFLLDNLDNPRSRIIWKRALGDLLRNILPSYYDLFASSQDTNDINLPKIKFKKYRDDNYFIDFIIPDLIISDSELENYGGNTETGYDNIKARGTCYYKKRHEFNLMNRIKAIEYHGTICKICGFDFEKVYGTRGRNYIEIHCVKPQSDPDNQIIIDPRHDLIPVCANCHRIIHREKDNVLSPAEVRRLIELNKN